MSRNRSFWAPGGVLGVAVVVLAMLAPSAWAQSSFKTLHRFNKHSRQGDHPVAGLIFDQAGNLYGTTSTGGLGGQGSVFELTRNSDGIWKDTVIHTFTGADGGVPLGTLIFDQAGNLYGTTRQGGAHQSGTVFKLAPGTSGSWTETVLYSFCSLSNCSDGAVPFSSLIFDQAGNLYGTTVEGGSSSACNGGCGTAFELTPNSGGTWNESVLYSFCSLKNCHDGAFPFIGGLVFDLAGNLYGTTEFSGDESGGGVVFELSPNGDGSWKESVLHAFCSLKNCHDGANPLDALIFDKAGNLYGTAEGGGAGSGVVFELSPIGDGRWKEKVLHSFVGRNGAVPIAGLIFDPAGNLYGTTFEGGVPGGGVVFKLTPHATGAWGETVLHDFSDKAGAIPYSGLVFDTAGNLYGTTYGDSNSTFGSVYEITP